MGPVAQRIKAIYDKWDKQNKDRKDDICSQDPFRGDMWIHYYMFPELLRIAEETLYHYHSFKRQNSSYYKKEKERRYSFLQFMKSVYTNLRGEIICYPCWILESDEVIRIMQEIEIIE